MKITILNLIIKIISLNTLLHLFLPIFLNILPNISFLNFKQVSFNSISWSKNILIKSSESSYDEYFAYLEAHKELISFIDYWNAQNPNKQDKKSLLILLEEAKYHYLQNNLKQSLKKFKDITKMSLQNDWPKEFQKIIQKSYLYLAKHSTTNIQKQLWLKELLSFSPKINTELLENFKSLKNDLDLLKDKLFNRIIKWQIPQNIPHNYILKINGEKIKLKNNNFVSLYPGLKKITIISDETIPISKIIDANKLKDLKKITFNKIVEGDNNQPILSFYNLNTNKYKIFFNPKIIRKFDGSQWDNIKDDILLNKKNNLNDLDNNETKKFNDKKITNKKLKWLFSSFLIVGGIYLLKKPFQKKKIIIYKTKSK